MNEQSAGPGEEVDADDPGVPNDPPGPDVPRQTGSILAPDVPLAPQVEQPDAVKEVDGADPNDDGRRTDGTEGESRGNDPEAEEPD